MQSVSDEEAEQNDRMTIFSDDLPRMDTRSCTDDYLGVLWIETRFGMIGETTYLVENLGPLLVAYKHKPLRYLTHQSRHGILVVFATYTQAVDAHFDVICEGKFWGNGRGKFGAVSHFDAAKFEEIRTGLLPAHHSFA